MYELLMSIFPYSPLLLLFAVACVGVWLENRKNNLKNYVGEDVDE